jgi:hypothetical protein
MAPVTHVECERFNGSIECALGPLDSRAACCTVSRWRIGARAKEVLIANGTLLRTGDGALAILALATLARTALRLMEAHIAWYRLCCRQRAAMPRSTAIAQQRVIHDTGMYIKRHARDAAWLRHLPWLPALLP